ncbi:LuxR C-terminal-related transcriptional regulator [Arthrobacter sp. Hor0625]|uniref:LuxR C-terminal-related transcriptional regulator n=1 Tax=Arthrobacter sp. Hor0625 TaxID=3457358 RepID=UPI00403EC041
MESLTDAAILIGRSGVVKDVVHCLRDEGRAGALILGGAGSGKTVVVKAVLAELHGQGSIIRLTATQALASVQFGALAPYLAGLPDHDLDSSSAVLAAVTAALRAEPALALFVIDDAQYLDRGTTRLLAQAVATGAARLLAACRPGTQVPEEFLALWGDGVVAKFDLVPLSRAEVHQLCEQVLHADVSPWVSELFASATEGNPYMLLSLIEHSRATGALAKRRGTWFLLAPPDLGDVPAADLLDHHLRSMSDEEKTAAAIVALAGPLSLGQILRFSSPRAVDALEGAGIITVSREPDRIVRPASPLIGEIIRRRVPAGRSAGLRASLLALPWAGKVLPDAVLNQLRWALDSGAEPPAGDLLEGAIAANAGLDTATARRAAEAIGPGPLRPEARLQLAYSDYILGRRSDAADGLRAAQPLRYGRASYLAALLAGRLKDLAAGLDVPLAASGTDAQPPGQGPDKPGGPDAAGRDATGPDAASGDPAGRSAWLSPGVGLASALALEDWDGRTAELAERLQALLAEADNNPDIRIPAASRLAEAWMAEGRVLAALGLGREAWHAARTDGLALPLSYEDVLARHCLALARAGEWEELASVLDDYASGMPTRLLYSGGLLHLMRGYSRLRQGRVPESLAELLLAVEELLIADPWQVLAFGRALAAYAAATAGQLDEAAEQAQAFRSADYRAPETLRLLAEAYCTAAEQGAGGDAGAARRELARLADEAQRQGLRTVETDIRRLAVRAGDTGAAEQLAASSAALEGPEARLLHTYALSVAAGDSPGLMALSDQAMNAGHLLLALEAAQQAARLLKDDPEKWKLTAVQRKVHHRMVAAGMSGQLDIVHGENHAELTARESEILDLVAGGATNAEIAARLTLSQRTVEGHLYRIFGKLGVSRRGELLNIRNNNHQPP